MSTPTQQLFQSATSLPELYETFLVDPLFRPFAMAMIDAALLTPGERVLDVACGTGIVTRLAQARVEPGGAVVGVDLSPLMLNVARRAVPSAEFREGNAAALPLEGGEKFDAVLCHQGVQFFPDKPAAAREMRRALVSGGRALIATWLPLADSTIFFDLTAIGERHLGAIHDHRHGFGDPQALTKVMSDAGFKDVRITTIKKRIHFDNAPALIRLNSMALVGMSTGAGELGGDRRTSLIDQIVADSEPVIARYADGNGISFDLSTNLAIGIA